ncbi:MAG: DUF5060 domain-containing protein, partial [Planctomycetota bacterium]
MTGSTRRTTAVVAMALTVALVTGGAGLLAGQAPPRDLGELGRFARWSKIEIDLTGPHSQGRGEPNPFAIPVDVTFSSPGGRRYRVPAFYDGDGRGGLDGHVWKVRFSADEVGRWTFRSSSPKKQLDGYAGHFAVAPTAARAEGFWKWGRLESVGTPQNGIRYLKFRDGPYWLKAGCDDPENFLGSYENYDSLAKRKAAVDHLAARGVNSMYVMTHNLQGDDNDVWPWLGQTPGEAKSNGGTGARFDVARLDGWRKLFEHMQTQGVVPYLVLEDDSAWDGYDHRRYYREMVARFGYLPALIFNFNEEHNENYRFREALEFTRELEKIDPYDHPRGIHNVNRPNNEYVDALQLDFTSIQTGSPSGKRFDGLHHNQLAVDWIRRCRQRNRRVLMVNFDEGRPEEDRRAWWSAYLGGGVWEAHVLKPYDRPMSAWEPVWTELGGTRTFMESLPFWEMEPANGLVSEGRAFCLAKPPEAYALYLPAGGTVAVELADGGSYDVAWWKPTNGRSGRFQHEGRLSGGRQTLRPPGPGDWAL